MRLVQSSGPASSSNHGSSQSFAQLRFVFRVRYKPSGWDAARLS
jgi:hypothetical protein